MARIYLARVEQIFPYPRFTNGYVAMYACKIGMVKGDDQKRLNNRIRTIQVNTPWKVSLDAYSEPMPLEEVKFVEDYYSLKFWRENMHGEWFAIMPEMLYDLKKEIEEAHLLRERRDETIRFLEKIFSNSKGQSHE